MKRPECWIGAFLGMAGGALWLCGSREPLYPLQLWELILGYGIAILGLGLVRDVYLVATRGRGRGG